MSNRTKFLKLLEASEGIVFTRQVESEGISRQLLRDLVNEGLLERLSRGVYVSPDAFQDEMYILQSKYSRAIFSHDTALYMHDLTDRYPLELTVTVPSGYNASSLKDEGIKVHFIKKDLHRLGEVEAETAFGRTVRIYDKERTICDIVRNRSVMDTSILYEAIRNYASRKDKDLNLLMQYAKHLNIQNIVRNYMEVLI